MIRRLLRLVLIGNASLPTRRRELMDEAAFWEREFEWKAAGW